MYGNVLPYVLRVNRKKLLYQKLNPKLNQCEVGQVSHGMGSVFKYIYDQLFEDSEHMTGQFRCVICTIMCMTQNVWVRFKLLSLLFLIKI